LTRQGSTDIRRRQERGRGQLAASPGGEPGGAGLSETIVVGQGLPDGGRQAGIVKTFPPPGEGLGSNHTACQALLERALLYVLMRITIKERGMSTLVLKVRFSRMNLKSFSRSSSRSVLADKVRAQGW
jgi:hypothetical protein